MPARVKEMLKRRSCGYRDAVDALEVEGLAFHHDAAALGVVVALYALLQEVVVLEVVVEGVGAAEAVRRVRRVVVALRSVCRLCRSLKPGSSGMNRRRLQPSLDSCSQFARCMIPLPDMVFSVWTVGSHSVRNSALEPVGRGHARVERDGREVRRRRLVAVAGLVVPVVLRGVRVGVVGLAQRRC